MEEEIEKLNAEIVRLNVQLKKHKNAANRLRYKYETKNVKKG